MENYHVLDLHVNLLIGEQQFRGDLCDEADRFSIRKRTLAIFHLIFTSRRVFREIYLVDAQHVFDRSVIINANSIFCYHGPC